MDQITLESSEKTVEAMLKTKLHRISQLLSRAMKEKGLNQRALAQILGKEPSYISKVLAGEMNLTLKTVSELEGALGVVLLAPSYSGIELKNIRAVPDHTTVVSFTLNETQVKGDQLSADPHIFLALA